MSSNLQLKYIGNEMTDKELDASVDAFLKGILEEILEDERKNDEQLDEVMVEVESTPAPLVMEAKNVLSDGQTKVEPSLVIHEEHPERIKWDDDVIALFNERFPGKDIYNMNLEELRAMAEEVEALREEYSLIELAYKVLSNGAYGAAACADAFYFYNLSVAGDITGECRELTKYFWNNLEKFFHEDIWERKDLWEKFGFELDESKHDLCRSLPVSCYSDTDSVDEDSVVYVLEEQPDDKPVAYGITISNLYNKIINEYGFKPTITYNGQILLSVPRQIQILNIGTDMKSLAWSHCRYLMKHSVNKQMFKITTTDGKEIIVTGDHSCMVKRNGRLREVKAYQIDKNKDKLVVIGDDEYTEK